MSDLYISPEALEDIRNFLPSEAYAKEYFNMLESENKFEKLILNAADNDAAMSLIYDVTISLEEAFDRQMIVYHDAGLISNQTATEHFYKEDI